MFTAHYTVHLDGVPVLEVQENFSTKDMNSWDDFFAAVDEHASKETEAAVVLDETSASQRKRIKEGMNFNRIKTMGITMMFKFVYHMQ